MSGMQSSPEPQQDLREALRELYRVTERYSPKLSNVTDERLREGLVTIPRHELDREILSPYADEAVHVLGDIDDYRYFLPRLLELSAQGWDSVLLGPELLIGRLTYAAWADWPPEESSAVRRFLLAMWRQTLAEHPGKYSADALTAPSSHRLAAAASTGTDPPRRLIDGRQ